MPPKRDPTTGLPKGKSALDAKSKEKGKEKAESGSVLGGPSKGKSALEAKGKASHVGLNKLAVDIGERLRQKIEKEIEATPNIVKNSDGLTPLGEKIQKISEISGVKTGFFDFLFADENISKYSITDKNSPISRDFDGDYRKEKLGMDEFVSTSTVRELLTGMVRQEKLSEALRERIGELVDLVSVVRAQTKHVGFAVEAKDSATGELRKIAMQHPTEGGSEKTTASTKKRKADTSIGSPSKVQKTGGVFADWELTVSEHFELDTKRKESVLKEMDKALNEGKTAEEVVTAGVLVAIDFTLSNMMAPASASNVSGHIARKEEEKIQTSDRENMKKMADILNGKKRASQSATSVWQGPGIGSDPEHPFTTTLSRGFSDTRDPAFVATALKPEPEPTVATALKPDAEPPVATGLTPEPKPPVGTVLTPEPLLG